MKKILIAVMGFVFLTGCNTDEGDSDELTGNSGNTEVSESDNEESDNQDQSEDDNQDGGENVTETESELMESVILEETVWSFDAEEAFEIKTEVGPVLIEGEYAIVPITFENASDQSVTIDEFFGSSFSADDTTSTSDIRLIDSENQVVHDMAVLSYEREDADHFSLLGLETYLGEGSLNQRRTMDPRGEGVQYVAVFRAPESDVVQIMFQNLGVAENVPVVSEEILKAENSDEEAWASFDENIPSILDIIENEIPSTEFEAIQDSYQDLIYARVSSVEEYEENLESSVRRINEVEQSTLMLSSDVLFEFDSADLTSEADQELESAINELSGAAEGDFEIVGHTDNEHTEEYNQTLSEERAESVYNRIQELISGSEFDNAVVRGESFREPLADNETVEGRAQNRRVEILFTPPAERVEVEVESTEFPDALGEVADYPDSVSADGGTVELLSLREVDHFLIGRVKVTSSGNNLSYQALTTYGNGAHFLTGARGWSYQDTVGYSGLGVYSLTLLNEGKRYYPLDYYQEPIPGSVGEERLEEAEGEVDYIVPLAERSLPSSATTANATEGAYYLATIIWPAVDTDEVTIELGLPNFVSEDNEDIQDYIDWVQPWRINNIPVEITD